MANHNFNQDQVLRSALGKTPECLPVETLAGLAEQKLAPAAETTARAHVAGCTYCSNELAMLVEFQSAEPRPGEAADVAWIQAELRRRSSAALPATRAAGIWAGVGAWISKAFPTRAWQMVPVAAALLLMVGGGMYLRQGNEGLRPPTGGEPVWRSLRFAGVAPLGEVVAAPTELHWSGVRGASKYLVRIMEVDRTEIWQGEAVVPQIALPDEVRAQMTAGRTFLWIVAAKDYAGSTISETSLQTFHMALTTP